MRRIATLFIIVVLGVTTAPSSAWAVSLASPRTLQMTGRFSGLSGGNPGDSCGGVARMDYGGSYTVDGRSEFNGIYDMDVCISLINQTPPWVLSGTFTITTNRGIVLRGTVSGTTYIDHPEIAPFTITVNQSTGEGHQVRGTVSVRSEHGGLYNEGHDGTFTTAFRYAS